LLIACHAKKSGLELFDKEIKAAEIEESLILRLHFEIALDLV
jgi:hypothetical protein